MKRTGSGSGPRQDGCTCGELVPEHLPDCPVVPFAAVLSSPETTPAGVLPDRYAALEEFLAASDAVEAGVVDFTLHASAVERLRAAREALR